MFEINSAGLAGAVIAVVVAVVVVWAWEQWDKAHPKDKKHHH